MAITTLNSFKTNPGRVADHIAAVTEALGHLNRLGHNAMAMQTIAGTEVGIISVASTYADNAAHVAALQALQTDEQWQEFFARATAGASAVQVESSIFSDVDPTFTPSPDRPLGAISLTQWRALPGRAVDFMAHVETAAGHITRLGGTTRVLQSIIGAHPMTFAIPVGFADLDSYGEFADKQQADEQFMAFWGEVMMNPSADLIRTSLNVAIG